jgi:hypothetical protein
LGTFSVKIDKEDEPLFRQNCASITTIGCNAPVRVRFNNVEGRPLANRLILEMHNDLDYQKNVKFRDGNPLNLTKKNLYQVD